MENQPRGMLYEIDNSTEENGKPVEALNTQQYKKVTGNK